MPFAAAAEFVEKLLLPSAATVVCCFLIDIYSMLVHVTTKINELDGVYAKLAASKFG